ncbi:MAG: SRPBCC family protein [Mariniphaga sp.]
MKKDYRGIDGTVGFISAWESQMKDVGKGEQEIMKIIDHERIDYELRFLKPFAATNNADFTFEAISDSQTKVKWGFSGKMKYPMNLFLLIKDMEGMLGKDLQMGLDKLKANLEEKNL